MSRVSIYVNSLGRTEEQFDFYGRVFGSEPRGLMRRGDLSPDGSDTDRASVMHIELDILGGLVLMGTDLLESAGHRLDVGNNMWINLEPDSLDEARRLFAGLSDGATEVVELQEMFWGAHWGSLCDRYGIRWMVNCAPNG